MSANGSIYFGPCVCNICFGTPTNNPPPDVPGVNLDDWGNPQNDNVGDFMEVIWGVGKGYSKAYEPFEYGGPISDIKYPWVNNAELAAYANAIAFGGERPVWVNDRLISPAVPSLQTQTTTGGMGVYATRRHKLIIEIFSSSTRIAFVTASVNSNLIPGGVSGVTSITDSEQGVYRYESAEFTPFIPGSSATIYPVNCVVSWRYGRTFSYNDGPFFFGARIWLKRL